MASCTTDVRKARTLKTSFCSQDYGRGDCVVLTDMLEWCKSLRPLTFEVLIWESAPVYALASCAIPVCEISTCTNVRVSAMQDTQVLEAFVRAASSVFLEEIN